MEELIDLIATNGSPAEVSDSIKNILFAKASERIENARPIVADSMFGGSDNNEQSEEESEWDNE
jgi:hypothetical protein